MGPLSHDRSIPCAARSREDAIQATDGLNSMLANVEAKYPVRSRWYDLSIICAKRFVRLPRTGYGSIRMQGISQSQASFYCAQRAKEKISKFLLGKSLAQFVYPLTTLGFILAQPRTFAQWKLQISKLSLIRSEMKRDGYSVVYISRPHTKRLVVHFTAFFGEWGERKDIAKIIRAIFTVCEC